MYIGQTVVDHAGVAFGTADELTGEVYDHAGIHVGHLDDDGVVRDFGGVGIGRMRRAPAPLPSTITAGVG